MALRKENNWKEFSTILIPSRRAEELGTKVGKMVRSIKLRLSCLGKTSSHIHI